MTARSYLYVPAHAEDRLEACADQGADAVILDLEDSVPPADRPRARKQARRWLDRRGERQGDRSGDQAEGPEVWVRINSPDAASGPLPEDVDVVAHPGVTGVIAAKSESAAQIARLHEALIVVEASRGLPAGRIVVSALIESGAGLLAMREIARAPRVVRMTLGEGDLIADLGLSPGPDALELLGPRTALVVTAAACGLRRPVGSVHRGPADPDSVRASSQALRRLGFAGRSTATPGHLAVINEVFG